MYRRIFFAALVAGGLAGLVVTLIQAAKVWPLILIAETYEEAGGAALAGEPAEWSPSDGIERMALTMLFNLLAGVGFALILNAALALARAAGQAVDGRAGLLWGAAGFVVFAFAPALGLPPEIPGMTGADLIARQAWWIATAGATATGLAALIFGRRPVWQGLGLIVLIAPHVVGAPHPPVEAAAHGTGVPAELAAQYVTATLVATAVFWLVLGGVSGWMQRRLG